MTRLTDRDTDSESETFVFDGRYLRQQAREAMHIFVAPLAGVYCAAIGADRAHVSRGEQDKNKRV